MQSNLNARLHVEENIDENSEPSAETAWAFVVSLGAVLVMLVALAVVKVAGGTGILLAIGALLYWTGKRRFQKTAAHL